MVAHQRHHHTVSPCCRLPNTDCDRQTLCSCQHNRCQHNRCCLTDIKSFHVVFHHKRCQGHTSRGSSVMGSAETPMTVTKLGCLKCMRSAMKRSTCTGGQSVSMQSASPHKAMRSETPPHPYEASPHPHAAPAQGMQSSSMQCASPHKPMRSQDPTPMKPPPHPCSTCTGHPKHQHAICITTQTQRILKTPPL